MGAFTTTLIASGSIEAALRAGVFGALSAGLAFSVGHGAIAQVVGNQGGAYIAHGVAQGVVSVLQGGKFRHGFASGFFGHLAGGVQAFGAPSTGSFGAMMGRTMVAAIVGGTVSQMTGGKFANGAMTAAFVHLFNAEGVNDEDISGFENSSALEDFVKIFRLDLMDGDSAGIFKIPVGAVVKNVNPKFLIGRQGRDEMSGSQVKRLAKDMKANGYDINHPIDAANVDGKLIIVDGHHRAQAAVKAGVKDVPVNVHNVTREQADQLMLEAAEARVRY